jgi:hypothetical protein
MPLGLVAIASIVVGFFLMWPLGWLFGVLHWPVFHSWGLVHGSFVVAWPLLSVLCFVAGRFLLRFRAKGRM